ncbi:MAG: hypothetical protein F6K36_27580 [Symploca sp. SIO3C6]|nr:hypothetical protein [Symploca sp. SIO3C6]
MSTKRRMQPFSICKHTSAQRYRTLGYRGIACGRASCRQPRKKQEENIKSQV